MNALADHDLIVIGGGAGGLSVAISSLRSGLERVRVIESGAAVAFPDLVPENRIDVSYGEEISSITMEGDLVRIVTNLHSYLARGCLIAVRCDDPSWTIPVKRAEVGERVSIDSLPDGLQDRDVLVVGMTNNAVEVAAAAAAAGAGVVLAAGGMDPALLAPAADNMLRRLERERRITVLYRAIPDEIGQRDGFPIAYFNDRRTPDLEFDHVVFASRRRELGPDSFGVSSEALASGKVWFQGTPSDDVPNAASSWEVGTLLAEACFPELDAPIAPTALARRVRNESAVAELRLEHYNATITKFEPTHSDLWVLRVKPDHGDTSHLPGQYASLGLGYWEDRIDDAHDPNMDDKWFKLIRRSYSISHPIFDGTGYLAAPDTEELEFYIVLVPPTDGHVPALTPRLALKRPGDRIYLGPKVAGRYTLASVADPESAVVFFATGTGEAPHNSMVTELLRKGHTGPIVSTVTVRNNADLGYLQEHRTLAKRFANYHYLPMPTREPDVAKRYLQDLIRDGDLERVLGGDLDPGQIHAFLCGNPAMIGLPEEENGELSFPDPAGVIELLVDRGFTLDKRGVPGNIHYEEYW
jgi:ferredoxin--NADP+ reductase